MPTRPDSYRLKRTCYTREAALKLRNKIPYELSFSVVEETWQFSHNNGKPQVKFRIFITEPGKEGRTILFEDDTLTEVVHQVEQQLVSEHGLFGQVPEVAHV